MSYKAYDAIFDNVTIPTATNGTNSQPFQVPKRAKTLSIHVPDLVGAATTLKIQGRKPLADDQATEAYVDLSAAVIAGNAPTFCALSGIPESAVTTISAQALGQGIRRFVASAAQTGAADALTIVLEWGLE